MLDSLKWGLRTSRWRQENDVRDLDGDMHHFDDVNKAYAFICVRVLGHCPCGVFFAWNVGYIFKSNAIFS